MTDELFDLFHSIGDAISFGIVLGTLLAYLPSIAAALSIAWTCLRFYEWAKAKRSANQASCP